MRKWSTILPTIVVASLVFLSVVIAVSFSPTGEPEGFLIVLLVVGGVSAIGWGLVAVSRRKDQKIMLGHIKDEAAKLCEVVRKNFLVQSCPTCEEFVMWLIDVSPNSRSVQYGCVHCGKKIRALAGASEAEIAIVHWLKLSGLVNEFSRRWNLGVDLATTMTFTVVPAPLPYEQTSREPIPAAVRTEVWRRDQGRCVECGSNQNLQYDHIIPVAKGGATSAQNLQLLCRQHNLEKHATI
jgi:hypothetical protein